MSRKRDYNRYLFGGLVTTGYVSRCPLEKHRVPALWGSLTQTDQSRQPFVIYHCSVKAVVLKPERASESPGGAVTAQISGPTQHF